MLLGSVIVANMMQSIAAIPITLRRLRLEKMILYQFGDTLDTDEARARVGGEEWRAAARDRKQNSISRRARYEGSSLHVLLVSSASSSRPRGTFSTTSPTPRRALFASPLSPSSPLTQPLH